MKRKRYSEEQIIRALKHYDSDMKVSDIYRELGIVEQTFYKLKTKYGGMDVSEAKRLRERKKKTPGSNSYWQKQSLIRQR